MATAEFFHINGLQNYTVPVDFNCITIECWGADSSSDLNGGKGGYTEATFVVAGGTMLQVGPGGTGGYGFDYVNGGINGGYPGVAGAGSFVAPNGFTSIDQALIVSGGGGAAGLDNTPAGNVYPGGNGGGDPAEDGTPAPTVNGKGATGVAVGDGGTGFDNGNDGGTDPLFLGRLGNGGNNQSPVNGAGGGGGGGLRGAGAGAYDGSVDQWGSGGGGSGGFPSLVPFGPSINVKFGDPAYATKPPLLDDQANGFVRITPVVCPCLAEGTMVCLMSGYHVPIERLTRGQILQSASNRPVRIEQAIRFQVPGRQFVRIHASALGRNQPAQDLLIRKGHPLLVQSREILPEDLLDLPGVESITLERPTYIYTLVTEQKQFVNMQGAMVATWSREAWEHEVRTKAMLFVSQ